MSNLLLHNMTYKYAAIVSQLLLKLLRPYNLFFKFMASFSEVYWIWIQIGLEKVLTRQVLEGLIDQSRLEFQSFSDREQFASGIQIIHTSQNLSNFSQISNEYLRLIYIQQICYLYDLLYKYFENTKYLAIISRRIISIHNQMIMNRK